MKRVSFTEMPTPELMELCIGALAELQERQEREKNGVELEYTQSKDCMFFTDQGVPADRPGWLYVPALSKVSLDFQPREIGGKKRYTAFLKECSVVEVRFGDGKNIFLRMESGERNVLRDSSGNLVARGAFKVL